MRLLLSLAIIFFILPSPALSADFKVSPIMLTLNNETKFGVITITNNGTDSVSFQIHAMEWTEDKDGFDAYQETKDIVYFPRLTSLGSGENQAIRIGIKQIPPAAEKTYRVYITELAKSIETKKEGVNVGIRFGFGAPIFVQPARILYKGEIAPPAMSKGIVRAVIKNTGSVHIRFDKVTFTGSDREGHKLYVKEINGWYLLQGASRAYTIEVTKDVCRKLSAIEVTAKSDDLTLSARLNVLADMCQP